MLGEITKANITGLKNVNFEKNPNEFDELAISMIDSYIDSLPLEARKDLRETQFKISLKRLLNIDYKNEPEMFEKLTKITIENFIKSQVPENQARASWAQSKIERDLKKFPTPLGRWQRMQEIFIKEVFEKENGFINTMARFKGEGNDVLLETKQTREISPLRLVTNKDKEL